MAGRGSGRRGAAEGAAGPLTVPVAIVSLSKRENYAAPAIERRSNFGTERKANSVLDMSEEMARRTMESDSTYVGWLRGRYKKRRERSYAPVAGEGQRWEACDAVG